MSKLAGGVNLEQKRKYNTLGNSYADFPIGTRVKVICLCQDMYFFNPDTQNTNGEVIRNSGEYLGIIVKWDEPRHYEGGHIQEDFNFAPTDLVKLDGQPVFYKGKGNHSVRDLETICESFLEGAYQKQIKIQELEKQLEDVTKELKETSEDHKKYIAAHGVEIRNINRIVTIVKEIQEESEWAYHTISEKLKFGFDEAQAVYRRETRCKGVFITTIGKCKKIMNHNSKDD